ncbi:MAG: fructose-6-phosphate aldolase, partial [Lachnospiraceae bacterium]|nr:fructose-6-phosphate aldolase [Candidatus Equihabitans merdae]
AYAAPYVNRIDGLSQDGVAVVKAMQDIIDNNGMMIELLAASFKNTRQVMELAQYGIGAATCPPDVIERLLFNDSVNAAVAAMNRDFHTAYGADTYMG